MIELLGLPKNKSLIPPDGGKGTSMQGYDNTVYMYVFII